MAQIPIGQQQRHAQIGHIKDGIIPSLTVPTISRFEIFLNFRQI